MANQGNKTAEIVERIANSKGIGDFGIGIGFGLALVAFFLAAPLAILAGKWDGHIHEQKECYELKEIEKKLYKLNTCTGELKEVELPTINKK